MGRVFHCFCEMSTGGSRCSRSLDNSESEENDMASTSSDDLDVRDQISYWLSYRHCNNFEFRSQADALLLLHPPFLVIYVQRSNLCLLPSMNTKLPLVSQGRIYSIKMQVLMRHGNID